MSITGSPSFSFSKDDLVKVAKGAAIAAIGAALTYLQEWLLTVDFGDWQPVAVIVNSVLANVVRKYLGNTLAKLTPLAVALLAIGFASSASAACRHITPMPTAYPADGQAIVGTMSGEVDNFWSTPITVRYGNYDWPADNGSGKCGGAGWQCLATFSRKANAWTITRCWQANPVLFDRHTGRRLP